MRELLLGSELIDAERAKEIGLVNRVVVQDDLLSEARNSLALSCKAPRARRRRLND